MLNDNQTVMAKNHKSIMNLVEGENHGNHAAVTENYALLCAGLVYEIYFHKSTSLNID